MRHALFNTTFIGADAGKETGVYSDFVPLHLFY